MYSHKNSSSIITIKSFTLQVMGISNQPVTTER